MSTKNKSYSKKKKASIDYLKFDEKPIILISDKLSSQVNRLHQLIGKTEWSGILLYEVLEGSISDPANLVIIAQRLFLMDIGSSAYTQYENDVDSILELDERYPQYSEGKWQIGHIHTHHSLGASFSGTDMSELEDNCASYNYYLSLVMDFQCNPEARIAVYGSTKGTGFSFINEEGEEVIRHQPEREIMGLYKCKVKFNSNEEFEDRYSKVYDKRQKAIEKSKKKNSVSTYKYGQGVQKTIGYGGKFPEKSHSKKADDIKDINTGTVESYLYKVLNLNAGVEPGDLTRLIHEMDKSMPLESTQDQYLDFIDEYIEDIAIQYIGNNYLLTDEEYIDIFSKCLEILEQYKTSKMARKIASLIKQDYLGYIETKQELEKETKDGN